MEEQRDPFLRAGAAWRDRRVGGALRFGGDGVDSVAVVRWGVHFQVHHELHHQLQFPLVGVGRHVGTGGHGSSNTDGELLLRLMAR